MSCFVLSQILGQEPDLVHHAHRPPAEVPRAGGARPEGQPAPPDPPRGLRTPTQTAPTVSPKEEQQKY